MVEEAPEKLAETVERPEYPTDEESLSKLYGTKFITEDVVGIPEPPLL